MPLPVTKAVFLAALTFASSAICSPRDEQVTIPVRHLDLDLATPAGQVELDRRIRSAAYAICRPTYAGPGRPTVLPDSRCYSEALASVRDQVAAATTRDRATMNRASEVAVR